MVHQASNRHIQAVMNNLKFISLYYLAAKKSWILDWRRDFCDWSISSHSIGKVILFRRLTEYNTLVQCSTHANSTLMNRLKPWWGGVPWASCSKWCATPLCGIIIFSTISRMLRAVAAVFNIIQNLRWWSWALLCCVEKLPNFCRDQSVHKNTTAWKCKKIRMTRCEKSIFYPVLAKIEMKKSG